MCSPAAERPGAPHIQVATHEDSLKPAEGWSEWTEVLRHDSDRNGSEERAGWSRRSRAHGIDEQEEWTLIPDLDHLHERRLMEKVLSDPA